jgi:hypothetical protein
MMPVFTRIVLALVSSRVHRADAVIRVSSPLSDSTV